ncbi:PREDICTED: aspartic proteinase-like protein 2 [Lupinus angustifolius]|uniref:aspartic proteinase-like protein 2 n=1 Tax=Lupinus angustifolius TaxID=3871 RepID=UPI00092EA15F|nr:PREDICTED: aspartic proteinase-like protein 2 [Lupinus angustifolius]
MSSPINVYLYPTECGRKLVYFSNPRNFAEFDINGKALKDDKIIQGWSSKGRRRILYYTTIYLGSPPREFHVQIDTGSDTSWVTCVSCTGCPQTSNLEIKLNYFDPVSSSTYSIIPCSHHKCEMCSTNNRCSFNNRYGDGGGASGYIVSDIMYVSNISMGPMAPNFSVSLVFGCSNLRTGRLALNDRALDGILGFGKQDTSLISQLYSQGKAPRVFSHCLKGDISGGGILVLGEVVEPNMTYSPLISKQ